MAIVTDPELLKELNSTDTSATAAPSQGGSVVTDPALLAQLNAPDRSAGDVAAGYEKAGMEGVNTGLARTAGLPVDLYNLIGSGLFGGGPALVAEKLGYPDAAQWIRQNGYKPIYTGSSQSVIDAGKNVGVMGYELKTP